MFTSTTHIKQALKATSILAAATLISSAATFAADLKQNIRVTESLVRASDIFTDTGEKADEIVMEAPAPGKSRSVSGYELERIAKSLELEWEKPTYLKRVNVAREGEAFTVEDAKDIILMEAASYGAPADAEVTLFGRLKGIYLPVGGSDSTVELTSFEYSESNKRFTAELSIPQGAGTTKTVSINGKMEDVIHMPVFSVAMAPGDVITAADIQWKKVPANRVSRRTVSAQQDLIGKTVRRPMRPGKLLTETDVMAPVVIKKGTRLTMVFSAGGMRLTAAGRAMEDGSMGETIRLMNMTSKQMVDGKVLGPNNIEVINSNSIILAAN